jgi:transketolase
MRASGCIEHSAKLSAAVHAKAVALGKHVVRMTTAAGSGHPSSALGLGHVIVELMYRRMRYDPADPWNPANDRLVLSEGHAVPIVYAAYADLGGAIGPKSDSPTLLRVDDLPALRELHSVLDGHPNPAEGFPFFDAATGSLGQGLSVAAGLALAARLDGIPKRIFAVIGDGESREGQIWEAADFIVDYRLTNVCAVFSCNGWGQANEISNQQSPAALARKLAAFGWEVAEVDGHDPDALSEALSNAGRLPRPLAVLARTIKGWGVDFIQHQNYHGRPVPAADLPRALSELDATAHRLEAAPVELPGPPPPVPIEFPPPSPRKPVLGFVETLKRCGLEKTLAAGRLATRTAYGAALVALGDADTRIVALDGDVSNSTYSNLFAREHPDRFFECKIAEQNMVSVAVGLAAAGKIPFASSFAKFIARGVDQIDMAGITRANVKLVGSHSGVSLAADGPSQMGLSDVAYFRSMTRVAAGPGRPACVVFHPSDAVSAFACTCLMAQIEGMCYLRTHRPEAPFLYSPDEVFEPRGCKHLRRGSHVTLVGSGFILHTVLAAAKRLDECGVSANVFDVYTLPLHAAPILDAARSSGGGVLVVEDNYAGGVYSELAEAAAKEGDVRVHGLTVSRIPKSARTADELFDFVGVGVDDIIMSAKNLANR